MTDFWRARYRQLARAYGTRIRTDRVLLERLMRVEAERDALSAELDALRASPAPGPGPGGSGHDHGESTGDWDDDYGTGVHCPHLEAMHETASADWREVLWWAWALEGRVHELELAAGAASSVSVVFSTDLARFTTGGDGVLRDPRVGRLRRGDRVIVTDDDADWFWAVVLDVRDGAAMVHTDWTHVPRHPIGE